MASYPTAVLRDVCASVEYGYTASSTPDPSVGPRFLRITDIVPERLDWESVPYCEIEPKKLAKHRLHTGDIVVARTGATTGWARYISNPPDAVFASYLVRLRPSASVDARYVGFVVESSVYKEFIQQHMGGAAQPNANAQVLTSFEIPLPPLPIQRRIAGILSAYDELIENSQRRIKILEAMARALYREWFVHFRFPGHDSVPRVPSPLGDIPKGWEVKRLDAACRSIQDGDWIETKDQGGEDYRLLQISNVGVGEFIETGNFRYVSQQTFDRLRCNEIVPDDLLVARMPTPIGRGWLATKMPWRMITAVDVAIIRADRAVVHPLFLVQVWNESSNLQRIAAQASGTTRLRITRRELAAMEFVIPPLDVQQKFADVVQPHGAMIEALRQQIQVLRRTRDLLLPRLLSGQVELAPSNGKETTL